MELRNDEIFVVAIVPDYRALGQRIREFLKRLRSHRRLSQT
ncbi:hypothetical protein [Rhizobium mongolense]